MSIINRGNKSNICTNKNLEIGTWAKEYYNTCLEGIHNI